MFMRSEADIRGDIAMKRMICLICVFTCLVSVFSGCASVSAPKKIMGTQVFTDSLGREVSVPVNIEAVAPSGSLAQMMLISLSPELLVGTSRTPEAEVMAYLPDCLEGLPEFGQFYGSKANLNMESLVAASPQIIIDMGNVKDAMAEELDSLQERTGIPVVFIEASLDALPESYRMLGALLGQRDAAEALAAYIEKALTMCEENRAKILPDEQITVAFGTGPEGLACNAAGSMQADVIELVGAVNAVTVPEEELRNRNGGNEISMEQMYVFDPDVMLLSAEGAYELAETDPRWQSLRAVQEGNYYEIPDLPYSWMANPPSVNRVLGLYWLGNLLYPALYDYDMVEKAQEFYKLFWHYDLSEEEAQQLLSRGMAKE
ncbi:MAG: ABC transporter substrate-binding protein [Ruminococcaceae bacterium]|nr:ABC transporter substrate-binding protein [Oscillospiraceae bacterium]